MKNRLQIAVAGAGVIGRRHIRLLGESPRARLCALVDPAPQAAALAQELGVPHFASLDALFDAAAGPRVDGVILATPNPLHVPQALRCLQAGVPALIEKPLADSQPEVDRLLGSLRDADIPLLVGHHRRYSAALNAAREVVRSGRLGRLVCVSGTALFHKPDAYFETAWRRQAGGGPIMINLIHEIDSLRFLCGEIVAVQAMASNAVRGFEVEDTAVMTLRFASGALGTFALSDTAAAPRSWEQTSGEDPAYPRQGGEDCYFIAGTQGSLAVPTLRWWAYEGERSWNRPFMTGAEALDARDPLRRQLAHFCNVIERQAAPRVTVEDAARTLRATLAVVEAVRTGGTVVLD